MRKIILLFCSIFLLFLRVDAQDFSEWQWDQYQLAFSAPSDFRIKECTDTELHGSCGKINLNIIPFSDMGVSEDVLDDYIIQIASDQNLQELEETKSIELEGFVGSYIEGEMNGKRSIIMVILDNDEKQNFIINLKFENSERENIETILESFTKLESQEEKEEDDLGSLKE